MSRYSFDRTQRLTRRPEFLACYDQGHRSFTANFIIFILPRANVNDPSRYGAAVGKKIGSSVRRNRIKRLLRECFRLHIEAIGPGLDIAVVARRSIDVGRLTLKQVEDELLSCVIKA
ncbi:Ribonuclease P protein component [Desulfovibrionales bacterium]